MLRRWEGEEEDDEDRELWREMSERPGKWLAFGVGLGVALWGGINFLFAASPAMWGLSMFSLAFFISGVYIFALFAVGAIVPFIASASFAAGSAYLPWFAFGVGLMIAASAIDAALGDEVLDENERKLQKVFDAFGLDEDDEESDSGGRFKTVDGPLPAEMCATYDAYIKWNGSSRFHVAPNGVRWRGVRVPCEDVEVRETREGYLVKFVAFCPEATSEHAEEGRAPGLAERFELSFVRRGKGKAPDFEGTFARETEGSLPVILEKKTGVLNEAYDAVAASEAKALAATRPRDTFDEADLAAFDRKLLGNPRSWDAEDVQTWLEAEGMENLKPEFKAQEVDGDTLLALTSADMRELGVSAMPARKKLARALERLRRFDDE